MVNDSVLETYERVAEIELAPPIVHRALRCVAIKLEHLCVPVIIRGRGRGVTKLLIRRLCVAHASEFDVDAKSPPSNANKT
jgi:hypothetical protein